MNGQQWPAMSQVVVDVNWVAVAILGIAIAVIVACVILWFWKRRA